MCLSLSETEVFARRKRVLLEKFQSWSQLKRQEPEKVQMGRSPSSLLHLDNNPILSQQGGRSGQAKRLQDAGPRFVIKFWFLFGSNCLNNTENKTRDPNCLNERTPVCNKTRESVGGEFRQEQTMPDTSSVPTTSHSQVFVLVCLCLCVCPPPSGSDLGLV